MANKGLVYKVKSIGPRIDPEDHLSVQAQKQNND